MEKRLRGHAHYDTTYGNFQSALYEEIRCEAFGEDIGQQSWLTADEQDTFLTWLHLASGKSLLDVACGAGGPALRIAKLTGCSVVGIDVHEQAVSSARSLAEQRGLAGSARFEQHDASQPFPFPDNSFNAITCIDAINHLPDRSRALAEWTRMLKPGGLILFTDPVVVTGPISNSEVASRSSIGFFLFTPADYNERVIAGAGLRLLIQRDLTRHMAAIAERRYTARESRSAVLRGIEGDETYAAQQDFLATAARLGREGRLSRFVYVAEHGV
jgi:2-polyprenyl-3-methyl-5-hydroxy-6-metoxy-1,4-benzoquinol methylase